MTLGPRPPAPRSSASPRPSAERSPGLRRRHAPSPARPARPRSPTPRSGRRSARPPPRGLRPPRPPAPRPAQRPAQAPLVPLGAGGTPDGATWGGAAAGAKGRPRGARAGGWRGHLPEEAPVELGERRPLSSGSLEGHQGEDSRLKRGISQDTPSSPRLDRYKIAKQLTEKAIKEKKIFSIYGHYPVIRAALRRTGWVEKLHPLPEVTAGVPDGRAGAAESKRAEGKEHPGVALERAEDIHDVMSRLVKNEMPYFLWTVKRDAVDYHSLHGDQMLNHYGRTTSFTTKIGLCLNLRSLPWYVQANPDSFFPRCYGLCSESEKQAFLDDFRRTVASSILKWVVSHQDCSRSKARSGKDEAGDSGPSSKGGAEDPGPGRRGLPGQLVDTACRACRAYLGRREHEDIDVAEDAAEDLTEAEWDALTQQYYALTRGDAYISSSGKDLSQCQALLSKISSVNPQTEIDGLKNIWIVKPAAKSRGRDIVCMNRVEEILALVAADHPAKDNKWVVQKYIETPLLIYDTKFDIRQWFLVTDWNPLTIWFYKESYLRFSTQRFSLDNLDSAIHLCNNSIQKHLRNDEGRSPLLPPHNMWSSSRFREYLQQRGQASAWGSVVYPAMKRAVAHTMRVAQGHVAARRNSFELFGADFVLGRDFRPWLIEINSSPTMHASTPVTAQLCAQVQEDVIRVVVGRRDHRCCDVGNFELLWRQPAVGLPPSHGADLCVEGVAVRRAQKHLPPVSRLGGSSSLLDTQPLKGRRPAASLALAPGAPQVAPQRAAARGDAQVLACTLPEPLKRPPARRRPVPSLHTESGGKTAFPRCDVHHVDSGAPEAGLKAAFPKHADPNGLPSLKTAEGAVSRPPRTPENGPTEQPGASACLPPASASPPAPRPASPPPAAHASVHHTGPSVSGPSVSRARLAPAPRGGRVPGSGSASAPGNCGCFA